MREAADGDSWLIAVRQSAEAFDGLPIMQLREVGLIVVAGWLETRHSSNYLEPPLLLVAALGPVDLSLVTAFKCPEPNLFIRCD